MTDVVVVKTGTANLASVLAALHRMGANARLSDNPAAVEQAAAVLVPGVAAFAAAMQGLEKAGLVPVLKSRVDAGRPTLGICVGMQVFCEGSEESPGARGIGCVPGLLQRFGNAVRVPQLGWNKVTPDAQCTLVQPGYAYFANSYRLPEGPAGWAVATTTHGAPFVAALQRGAVLLTQFHPELSSAWGKALITRWLELV